MIKAYRLTEIGKLNAKELIKLLLLFLMGPLLLVSINNIIRLIICTVLIVASLITIKKIWKNKEVRDYPYSYPILLYFLFFSFIDVFLVFCINIPIVYSYGLIPALFAYMVYFWNIYLLCD